MISEKDKKEILEWIAESEDTNQYCERSLIFDAFLALDQENPNIEKAKSRILEILPIGSSRLVCPPKFVEETEIKNAKI